MRAMSVSHPLEKPNAVRQLEVPALLAAVLLVGSTGFVLSPILTEVAAGLGTVPARIALAISAFGAATAVAALTLSSFIDRRPAGQVLAAAALLLALSHLASMASGSWQVLCLSQALAGVAVGVLLPGTYATSAATAPPGREAARIGLVLTGWALSLVVIVPGAAFVAEHYGWRAVYGLLAGLSLAVAAGLFAALRTVRIGQAMRTPPSRALRLPGVAKLLVVMFAFMTAFYGSFAFFGEGVRAAFGLTAHGTGTFVLAYGVGFGIGGIGLSLVSPRMSRLYIMAVLGAVSAVYVAFGFSLADRVAALGVVCIWGIVNQMALNAFVVSLNQRAPSARGAVMGLSSAVTYGAVFAGPVVMGPVFAGAGFAAVTWLSAAFVFLGVLVTARTL